jgi:hypothetical protein
LRVLWTRRAGKPEGPGPRRSRTDLGPKPTPPRRAPTSPRQAREPDLDTPAQTLLCVAGVFWLAFFCRLGKRDLSFF